MFKLVAFKVMKLIATRMGFFLSRADWHSAFTAQCAITSRLYTERAKIRSEYKGYHDEHARVIAERQPEGMTIHYKIDDLVAFCDGGNSEPIRIDNPVESIYNEERGITV